MAIDRISFPASTPTAVADYQAQNTLISAAFSESANVVPFVGSAMSTGYVFQVGGTVYKVNGTVSITGTASAYVKITPSGATAAASFVASLTGVTWSTVYNGYYDGSGNRYLFDEPLAVSAGAIASTKATPSVGRGNIVPADWCPKPITATGIGEFFQLTGNGSSTIPSGGQWIVWGFIVQPSGSGSGGFNGIDAVFANTYMQIVNGGTVIGNQSLGGAAKYVLGFAWRIS